MMPPERGAGVFALGALIIGLSQSEVKRWCHPPLKNVLDENAGGNYRLRSASASRSSARAAGPQAITTLENALKNGATDRDVRLRLGLYLAESQVDTARAITLLEGLPSDDVEALNGLGVAYGSAGRYDDAIRSFNRVLALDPTNGLAYQNLASMALSQALRTRGLSDPERTLRLQQAEKHARRALEIDPALAKAYTTLGVVLARTGRKPEAIDNWKRAVELDGAEFDALYNLVIVLSQAGRTGEARAYARQFVATARPALYGPAIEQMRGFLTRQDRPR